MLRELIQSLFQQEIAFFLRLLASGINSFQEEASLFVLKILKTRRNSF